jgi:hypothetical protein
MSVRFKCPCCGKRLRLPESAAGHRIECPHCGETLRAPLATDAHEEDEHEESSFPSTEGDPRDGFWTPRVLGVASLFLGALSVPVLCIPVVGYASIGFSALGLLLGLVGMACSSRHGNFTARTAQAGSELFGVRAERYPLAGVGLCLIALALALLPFALR